MSTLYGIRIRLGRGENAIHVFAGWGVQQYAFPDPDTAALYIEENWQGFGDGWKAANLSVAPLLPVTQINPFAYILFERAAA